QIAQIIADKLDAVTLAFSYLRPSAVYLLNLRLLSAVAAILLQLAGSAGGAELSLKIADKEPPSQIDASLRGQLQSKAVQLLDGNSPAYEFWFCSEIPLKSKSSSTAKA